MDQDMSIALMILIGLPAFVYFACHRPHQKEMEERDAKLAKLAKYERNRRILGQAKKIRDEDDLY